MKKFFKLIYQFFLTIYIFESCKKIEKVSTPGISIFFIKNINQIKSNSIIKKYFEKEKFKLNRFKNKSKFIGFKKKGEIICSGWIYFGNKWNIEEIDKKIFLKRQYLLYDFITAKKFRNKGFYQLLLKFIRNKFREKKLMIYSLSHNDKSINAIEKSGFILVKKLKKYQNII
tara:strand:- start:12477 stop:12992 length:516 start_codon:yes stop_codon:yes gene_type:complete